MLYPDEPQAFAAYARALPGNVVFLVDTYDTLEGVRHAIEAGKVLRAAGHELLGVRLDSGDLAWLSIEARKLLDAAGFTKTAILASNDLDENIIGSLKEQGAAISVWGIGTRLVTGDGDPALGGVYKLAAVRDRGGAWQQRIKLSEQAVKVSTPGILNVRRFSEPGAAGLHLADGVYDVERGYEVREIVDPFDESRRKELPADAVHEDLLQPALRQGRLVAEPPSLEQARAHCMRELARLDPTHRRTLNPHTYPVGLEPRLRDFRAGLIKQHRDALRERQELADGAKGARP
jgi:nicotinate phosphoribosyltransferase